MPYIILTIILFAIEILYIRLAKRHFIVDKPNERSSHSQQTVRGGGIVFWFALLFFFLRNNTGFLLFFSGLTIVAIVSFYDDLRTIGQWPRLISHLAGITLAALSLNLFHLYPWYTIAAGYIVFIGILNAYNFMDGINGITGLYSLAILGALQWVNMKMVPFTNPDLIWYPMIASAVFLFFNFRKKALCFAGDVGSISVAFWIVTLLLMLMVKTGTVVWILLLAVYGIDSIFTIVHRIYLKQNIFIAHRMHFYQVLANECGIDHRIVSLGYALVQLGIGIAVIALWNKMSIAALAGMIVVPLGVVYLMKFKIQSKKAIFSHKPARLERA